MAELSKFGRPVSLYLLLIITMRFGIESGHSISYNFHWKLSYSIFVSVNHVFFILILSYSCWLFIGALIKSLADQGIDEILLSLVGTLSGLNVKQEKGPKVWTLVAYIIH